MDGGSTAPATVPRELPATQAERAQRGAVAQLDAEGARILAVYASQNAAQDALGIRSTASISNAIKHRGRAGGFQWRWYRDCCAQLRATSAMEPPQAVGSSRSKAVEQRDPATGALLHTFQTMQEACLQMRFSHSDLREASRAGTELKGYTWAVRGQLAHGPLSPGFLSAQGS